MRTLNKNASIVIIDNYDSFTYNLFHYVKCFTRNCKVFRNDEISINDLKNFDKIILSPGPGLPNTAGKMLDVIDFYQGRKPIFGVCLGMQAIAEYFGASLYNLPEVIHGKKSIVCLTKVNDYIYESCPEQFEVGRYHSWAIDPKSVYSTNLSITAQTEDEIIMSLKHNLLDITGVQFHPESVLTMHGKKIIGNWINH